MDTVPVPDRSQTGMTPDQMIALVEQHLKAEGAGDIDGAVAVYTDDVLHDDVGMPGGPRVGKAAAAEFYGFLTANFRTEGEEILHRYIDGNTLVLESSMTGRVIGEMFGFPGHGRQVTFRILHVFDFRDGLISREQVWLDSGSIIAQLTAE